VAASKLAAGREKDITYVRALLSATLIKPRILESRIKTLPITTSDRTEIRALIRKLIRTEATSSSGKKR
jgi:hypothetical protein